MTTVLTILYDGDSEAIRAHRLSLDEMAEPLYFLLKALRRAASSARDGKFSDYAKSLDLEVKTVGEACLRVELECVQRALPSEVVSDMFAGHSTEDAVDRLLQDLEAHTQGREAIPAIGKYLRALPSSVSRQVYEGRANGKLIRRVETGAVPPQEASPGLPRVVIFHGSLASVTLEPGREAVSIRATERGRVVRGLKATAKLVEQALELRHETVRVTAIVGDGDRLLRIDPADGDVELGPDERLERVRTQWAEALAELAK